MRSLLQGSCFSVSLTILAASSSALAQPAPAAAPAAPAKPDKKSEKTGFVVTSTDGKHRLKIGGYIHTDGRFFLNDDDDVATNDFVLRRARPVVEVTLFDRIEGRFMPDFGEGKVALQDAYVDAKVAPYFRIRVGKMKAPFGLERLWGEPGLVLMERGLPTALVPNRDVGLMLHGEIAQGTLAYAAGVFNGTADGGSVDTDIDDDKDLVARVFLKPFAATSIDAVKKLGLGFAVSRGEVHGDPVSTGLPSIKTSGQLTMVSFVTDTDPAKAALAWGTRTRLSPQGSFYLGPIGIWGEYVKSKVDAKIGAVASEVELSAYQVAGQVVLTGEDATDAGLKPENGVIDGGFGALELAARLHGLSVEKGAFDDGLAKPDKSVTKARGLTAGVNYYPQKGIKIAIDYDRTTFSGGKKDGGNRPTENALLTRVELLF